MVGLLELDDRGGFARMELGSPLGLLTLHPDTTSTEAHGNIAGPFGMRHLRFPWSSSHLVLVEGEPLVAAAMCHGLAAGYDVGSTHERYVLFVETPFTVRDTRARFTRESESRWRIELSPSPRFKLAIDPAGLPSGLQDEFDWPLEE